MLWSQGVPVKYQEDAEIIGNAPLHGDYFRLDMHAPVIAGSVQPGQFVHMRIPLLTHRRLRRPFSICDADVATGNLRIIYKVVGEGTAQLSELPTGVTASLLGPLGNGFTLPQSGSSPLIVAGGYGCAATYLLARRSPVPCHCLFGARDASELLLVEEFRSLGAEVQVATDDGSRGYRGFVTGLLEEFLERKAPVAPCIYACGPNPMLRALAAVVARRGLDAEVSLDHAMCCGVGACFACVVKRKANEPEGWEYVRTCTDGPVFKTSRTVWD